MSKTILRIGGMSCNHCVAGVKDALKTVPGLLDVDVKIGEASFAGTADVAQVKKAIEEEGYEVLAESHA